MKAIPSDPINGERYCSIPEGLSRVVEYDSDAGAFRPVFAVGLLTGSVIGLGGLTAEMQREPIDFSGSFGQYEIVAGVPGERIKMAGVLLIAENFTRVRFLSGFTGSALTGHMCLANPADGFLAPPVGVPNCHYIETEPSESLVLEMASGTQVGGWIQYHTE
jgi:hypothetical protein